MFRRGHLHRGTACRGEGGPFREVVRDEPIPVVVKKAAKFFKSAPQKPLRTHRRAGLLERGDADKFETVSDDHDGGPLLQMSMFQHQLKLIVTARANMKRTLVIRRDIHEVCHGKFPYAFEAIRLYPLFAIRQIRE